MIKNCKYCMSDRMNEKEQIFSNDSKHVALYCSRCGKHNGYKPQNKPTTDEYAMHFKMPYGMYKGYELQNVDDKYLDWLVDNTESEYLVKIFMVEKVRRYGYLQDMLEESEKTLDS